MSSTIHFRQHPRRISLKKLKRGDIIKQSRQTILNHFRNKSIIFSESVVLISKQISPKLGYVYGPDDKEYLIKLLEIKSKQIIEVTPTPRIVTSCEVCYVGQ